MPIPLMQECPSFRRSAGYCSKVLVCSVGRQPNTDTWVLGQDVQIDGQGMLIPLHQHSRLKKTFTVMTVINIDFFMHIHKSCIAAIINYMYFMDFFT
jgi:hypothetical protein